MVFYFSGGQGFREITGARTRSDVGVRKLLLRLSVKVFGEDYQRLVRVCIGCVHYASREMIVKLID